METRLPGSSVEVGETDYLILGRGGNGYEDSDVWILEKGGDSGVGVVLEEVGLQVGGGHGVAECGGEDVGAEGGDGGDVGWGGGAEGYGGGWGDVGAHGEAVRG